MRAKVKVLIVAVPVVAAVATGTVIAIKVRRRIRQGRMMPQEMRSSIEDLLRMKGEDFVPDGLGTSLYQRKLSTLTDRQLLCAYALIKVGEAMRLHGFDPRSLTREQMRDAHTEFKSAMATERGRKELLAELEGIGFDTIHGVMQDGALLAGIDARKLGAI